MAHVYNPNADGKQEDHHELKGGRKEDRKTDRQTDRKIDRLKTEGEVGGTEGRRRETETERRN